MNISLCTCCGMAGAHFVGPSLGDPGFFTCDPPMAARFASGEKKSALPSDAAERKAAPMAEGLLWYFPNALAEVARVSKAGNDQHNPGQPMHHARGKSTDHADCILRHLVDAGKLDSDGQRHTAKAAWRVLALLQEELERELGLPLPRNAKPAFTKED